MAKRRNKNKAKKHFAGRDSKLKINSEVMERMFKKEGQFMRTVVNEENTRRDAIDLGEKVRVTENAVLIDCITDSDLRRQNIGEARNDENSKPKNRKQNGNTERKLGRCKSGAGLAEDILIYPTEVDGETCIEITCGSNDAQLYLSKLCLGSKGACILFCDSWYTPNEFQTVSGRETAKDWKRSIRHKGRSLKMLISKGLLRVHSNPSKEMKHGHVTVSANGKSDALKPLSDDRDNNDNIGLVEQPIIQDTKPAVNKPRRGRKPKKLKQKNVGKGKNLKDVLKKVQLQKNIPDANYHPICAAKLDSKEDEDVVSEEMRDPRSEEEKRLDEFVKTLRLTKTTVSKGPMELPVAPSLHNGRQSVIVDAVSDPEMPVLQKEADILPSSQASCEKDRAQSGMTIEPAFQSTVTPPPTPPGDKPDVAKEEDDAVLIEKYKSPLALPNNGLKLTMNREKKTHVSVEKVKPLSDVVTSEQNPDILDTPYQTVFKSKIQSLLLQDALKSAKRYKEQLQQTPKTAPVKPIIHIPRVPPQIEARKEIRVAPTLIKNCTLEKKEANLEIKKEIYQSDSIRNIPNPLDCQDYSRRQSPHVVEFESTKPRNVISASDSSKLAGMSFQDFARVLSSLYGPLPFAALQEMHQRHDMIRFLTQGQVDPSSSAFLYPIMTQQILLAMNQQLMYRSCNNQDLSSFHKCEHYNRDCPSQPQRETAHVKGETVHVQGETTHVQGETVHIRKDVTTTSGVIPCSLLTSHDVPVKKRKYTDDISSDYALDLSVKKTKTSFPSATPQNIPKGDPYDEPLDFSMKKSPFQEKCFKQNVQFSVISAASAPKQAENTASSGPYARSMYCKCVDISNDDLTKWSVERVCTFLVSLDGCAEYAKTFHDQGISGRLLPHLTTQHLTRTLGMKVGPALTFLHAVDRRLKACRPSSFCRACNLPSMPQSQSTHTFDIK